MHQSESIGVNLQFIQNKENGVNYAEASFGKLHFFWWNSISSFRNLKILYIHVTLVTIWKCSVFRINLMDVKPEVTSHLLFSDASELCTRLWFCLLPVKQKPSLLAREGTFTLYCWCTQKILNNLSEIVYVT